jgi:hypothetical protein
MICGLAPLLLAGELESGEISDCCPPHTSIRSSTACRSATPLVRLNSNMNTCEAYCMMQSAHSLALLLCCWLQGCLEALSGAFDVAMRNRVSMRRDNKGQPGSESVRALSYLLLSAYAALTTCDHVARSTVQAVVCGRRSAAAATRAAGRVRNTCSYTGTGLATMLHHLHPRLILSSLHLQAGCHSCSALRVWC